MGNKISKELFEEAIGIEIFYNNDFYIDNNIISYVENDSWKDISINDFFFKCKEWALEQGYYIASGYSNKYFCMLRIDEKNIWEEFYSETEQQAVFNACEWILKEIKGEARES